MAEPRTWRPVLHGLAIWLAIALAIVLSTLRLSASKPEEPGKLAQDINVQTQGRYLVGLKGFGLPSDALVKQAETLKEGAQRAILLGELDSPARALAELPADEKSLRRLYSGAELADEEREAVAGRGWFGRLALATMGEGRDDLLAEARRTVVVVVAMFLGFLGGVLLGLVLLVVVVILVATGRLRSKTMEGRSLVYGETFALYMLLYAGMGLALSRVDIPRQWGLAASGLMMLSALAVLAWPVLRGVPWKTVKEDLGLSATATASPQAGKTRPTAWGDILAGFATYFMALPMLAAGVALMFLLTMLSRQITGTEPPAPSHPLSGIALRTSPWWVWAQVFIVAAILAPLVEEIFFRGALYTHLHRLGAGWHRVLRFLFATFASSVLFAAIHPQGLLAIPPLAALATAFCLARELRGSLLPAMIAHGINNGLITLVLMLAIA
ncbi:MAG: CPBP family intramembrane metalloprotease [Gemmataceae bacterium]|nr:CPBP family intramembrane metalloprotease [Gemmataceae bacterium]